MIPEINGNDTISFMDAMLARDNSSQKDSGLTRSYESISKEHQNNYADKNDNANEQEAQIDAKPKPEQDPVKVHKATSEIVNKVKKLVKGEEVEPIDEAELEDELGDLYFLLINIVETRINEHVEVTTKEIAHIDLKVEGAIEAILAHADLLEAAKDLGVKVEQLAKQLLPMDQIVEEVQIQIEPGLVEEVHIQIDAMIQDYQQEINHDALDLRVELGPKVQLVDIVDKVDPRSEDLESLAELDGDIEYYKEYELPEPKRPINPLELRLRYPSNPDQNSQEKPGLKIAAQAMVQDIHKAKGLNTIIPEELNSAEPELEIAAELKVEGLKLGELKLEAKPEDIEVKDLEVKDIKIDIVKTKPDLPEARKIMEADTDVVIVENEAEGSVEDLLSDSALGDSSGEDLAAAQSAKQNVSPTAVNRLATKFATIKPIEIGNYIKEQISELPRNTRQEVKLQLNPETWGKIDLTITRNENNEVSIKMIFQDGNSLNHMKTNLKDSLVELKAALRDNNLDLSKFEVGQSRSSSTAYDGQAQSDSFTETEDKQRERLLNRPPEWLRSAESVDQASFEVVAEGI